ncbi:MAG: hypothetical protein K2L56_01455 [Prevotella sp.]|nr:hypothetical protein [Prevotella sp.]
MKTLILFVMLAWSTSLFAQHLKDGCAWVYYNWYEDEARYNEPEYIKYELCGTQELNGKTYYKLYTTTSYWGTVTAGPTYRLGLREENGRVYADCDEYANLTYIDLDKPKNSLYAMPYIVTEDNEVVLYDFNWNVGDYVGPADILCRYYVKNKSNIRIETGEVRSKYEVYLNLNKSLEVAEKDYANIGDIPDKFHCYVIEGIGAIDYLGALYEWLNHIILPYGYNSIETCLNVFVDNNTIVYKAPDYTGAPEDEGYSYTTYKKDPFFGHLVTGIGSVKSDAERGAKPCLYDLSGRKVEGKPRPGVYIYNGRKVVVR